MKKKLAARLHFMVGQGIEQQVFPGAAAAVSYNYGIKRENLIHIGGYCRITPSVVPLAENTFFDLASLTKPLVTAIAALVLLKRKKIRLDDSLDSLLEQDVPFDKKHINLQQLLSHGSGLPAHRDYYKKLLFKKKNQRKDAIIQAILNETLLFSPGQGYVYSDLGFILLGISIEQKMAMSLDRLFATYIAEPAGLAGDLFFRPLDRIKITGHQDLSFAATEKCLWRRKMVSGEVHDDNCHILGGVCGHAGLFGNITGIQTFLCLLLDCWLDKQTHPEFHNDALRFFFTRQRAAMNNTFALGFDTPSSENSSAGHHFSDQSVGHLGFTGTSFWIDLKKQIVITLLSNRVHPSRRNEAIKQFRPVFHDGIMELLIASQ